MNSLIANWTPRLLSVLRIVAAYLFMGHGTQKWLAFPVARASPTTLWSLCGVAGLLELVGGSHAPVDFWPIVNRGELAALYSFLFLYLAAAGGGPWSIDRWL